MFNLKSKFKNEINQEIKNCQNNIKRLEQNYHDIPNMIEKEKRIIENLKGLLEDMNKSTHFVDPVFSYEEDV